MLEARVPSGCDWYGASGLGRIEVRAGAILGAVLIIAAVVLLWRRLPREQLAYAGTAANPDMATTERLAAATVRRICMVSGSP